MKSRISVTFHAPWLLAALTLAALTAASAARSQGAPVPPFECHAAVGFDLNLTLPGYILPTKAGTRTCVPFTSVAAHPPKGYHGDFYVDEFTDARLRQRWEACKRDKSCFDRIDKELVARHPPNREFHLEDAHERYLLGKIVERGAATDLATIRRPGFFARAPYHEPIAAADPDTYIVEFTAPADPYERLHVHRTANIRIRGWYIRGTGIADGHGGRKRALIIMNGGGGDRITAIDDPRDVAYVIDPKAGKAIQNLGFPNATSGVQGQRHWREVWFRLHQAGFDVLAMDRRGVGISGGYDDEDTLQQGRDILDIIAALRSGRGMRALSPAGRLATGHDAAVMVRDGPSDEALPVFLLGSSRGTMASGWAMTINFDEDCSYDMPRIECGPARHDRSIKGAMMVADFTSGVGYIEAQTTRKDDLRGVGRDRGLFIGGIEEEHNIVFFPSSAILAGVSKWPSGFFARGLWCYADGLEGEMDAYARIRGLKDLVVVRGPHEFASWPAPEQRRVTRQLIAYARAVLLGEKAVPGHRSWSNMKELVGTSDDVWEPSTHPTTVK